MQKSAKYIYYSPSVRLSVFTYIWVSYSYLFHLAFFLFFIYRVAGLWLKLMGWTYWFIFRDIAFQFHYYWLMLSTKPGVSDEHLQWAMIVELLNHHLYYIRHYYWPLATPKSKMAMIVELLNHHLYYIRILLYHIKSIFIIYGHAFSHSQIK